jgi:hypothetical protein
MMGMNFEAGVHEAVFGDRAPVFAAAVDGDGERCTRRRALAARDERPHVAPHEVLVLEKLEAGRARSLGSELHAGTSLAGSREER